MLSRLPAALCLVVACTLSTNALAQANKQALASRLAQLQAASDGAALAEQLTADAVSFPLANWSQRLDESVPPARQQEVREKLDVELKKFADTTHKTVQAQVGPAAEAALVPIFMEKLSEEEMQTIIAYLESPVSQKFLSIAGDAGNAWAQKVIDGTRASVEGNLKSFDAAAARIVGVPASSNSGK
jgi:hypothetical protein